MFVLGPFPQLFFPDTPEKVLSQISAEPFRSRVPQSDFAFAVNGVDAHGQGFENHAEDGLFVGIGHQGRVPQKNGGTLAAIR